MNDQPLSPRDLAVYWIEHIIRYKGASHLRSAGLDLAWYQRELLDILAFLIILVVLGIYVSCKFIAKIKSLLCQKKKKKVYFRDKIHKKLN